MGSNNLVDAVQQRYGAIARDEISGCGCGGNKDQIAAAIGYTAEDLAIAAGANLGVGCGNPLALAEITPGMTVLDLGSGPGFDAFLAWRRVGPTGRVIGVDMTDDMLARARRNAAELNATNVEFRKGRIEQLPVESNSVDLVISNCVINLSLDKPAVFREISRVLKPGGHFAVGDLVLIGELPASLAHDLEAYVGCIAGASQLSDYIRFAVEAGLDNLSVPQITAGKQLAPIIGEAAKTGCCGSPVSATLDSLLVSVKLHGLKPQQA